MRLRKQVSAYRMVQAHVLIRAHATDVTYGGETITDKTLQARFEVRKTMAAARATAKA